MTNVEYMKRAVALESNDYVAIALRSGAKLRLLHGMIGLCTETGEIQDQLKKHIFYGRELDTTNFIEELGDLLWYVALCCHELDVPIEVVMDKNIAKLEHRYKDRKFVETQALNRDLEGERNKVGNG